MRDSKHKKNQLTSQLNIHVPAALCIQINHLSVNCPKVSTKFRKISLSYLAATVSSELPLDTISHIADIFKRRLNTLTARPI